MTSPERLTIDMTVMRDYIDPQRHQLAVDLFAVARAGKVGPAHAVSDLINSLETPAPRQLASRRR
jgi:hypothetical protein